MMNLTISRIDGKFNVKANYMGQTITERGVKDGLDLWVRLRPRLLNVGSDSHVLMIMSAAIIRVFPRKKPQMEG